MKKFILFSFIILSCQKEKYDKSIHKEIVINNKKYSATWYVNDYYFLGDTVCYKNSDSSIVKICSPYIIIENTK